MIRDRFHRHPDTGRATELDPSTFSQSRIDWLRIAGAIACLVSAGIMAGAFAVLIAGTIQ